MQTDDRAESLIYVKDEPDVLTLKNAYDQTVTDLSWYLQSTRDSFDWRRNIWPGKSKDLRKHGADAFPWEGAADTEVSIIDERINTLVALCMSALNRANIRAYPVEVGDMGRAKVVSSFLKWMVQSYIIDFKRQMELGANYLFERGLMITYVGWRKEQRTFLQRLDINQIAQTSPDLAALIMEGNSDQDIIALFKQAYPDLKDKRVRKALGQLRKEGFADLPVSRTGVNNPCAYVCAPDGEAIFPAYTMDPQRVPYCFRRVLMTAQALKNKVASDGWDEEWVDEVIATCATGVGVSEPRTDTVTTRNSIGQTEELYEVIYAYQRLIDEDDNSEGIYCTVFAPKLPMRENEQKYAKFELLNGYDDYPFVVTKLYEDNKRMYELATLPEQLRGTQWQVKVERDSRIDRNSLTTVPPMMYPINGEPPADYGPGVRIPYRRQGEIQFGPTPTYNPGSVEMEQTQILEADRICGLERDNPLSSIRQQAVIDKFLGHVRDVLKMAFKCYQRFGPDEVFFRVTGNPDPQKFSKGSPDEDFDIIINFDVLSTDPENLEKQLQQMVSLVQLDRNGRMNMDALLEISASAINPVMADYVLQPAEAAAQKMQKDVTDDIAKISSAIEVPARPNGPQVAMQIIQQYASQPDVAQRLQQDKAFAERLGKYAEQYQFIIQQQQNAQIGKIGTQPAQMGGMQTQGMNQ